MVGEIRIANIPFTDATVTKIRPVLLIKANSFSDILYMPLTTNISVKGFKIDNIHLQDEFLPKTSVDIYEKIGVIATSLLVRKIGLLNQNIYKEIISRFIQFLQQ
ncbi:MAG: type II toxin-antitoxin system PemK/MazF family toxin [Segetibacter sp.]